MDYHSLTHGSSHSTAVAARHHRGVVTKAFGQRDALIEHQPTPDTFSPKLRSLSILEEILSVKVDLLLSLDEKFQIEIEDP